MTPSPRRLSERRLNDPQAPAPRPPGEEEVQVTAKEAERKLRGFAYGKWGAENYELPSEEAARGVLEELDASRSRVAALEGAMESVADMGCTLGCPCHKVATNIARAALKEQP